jgi:hypothetical protein
MSVFIFALFFIGLGVLMIWGIKETLKDKGIEDIDAWLEELPKKPF